MLEEEEVVAGREVAILVEDAVVGQKALPVQRLHLARRARGAGVEEVAVEDRRSDEGDDPARRASDLVQRPLGRADEARAKEQVLGRVARDGELGKEHEIGAGLFRLVEAAEDAVPVPVEVADDRVDLGEREAHAYVRGYPAAPAEESARTRHTRLCRAPLRSSDPRGWVGARDGNDPAPTLELEPGAVSAEAGWR